MMRIASTLALSVLLFAANVAQCESHFGIGQGQRGVLPTPTTVSTSPTGAGSVDLDKSLLDLRGGAQRRKSAGSSSKSTRNKTVTGKRKVGKKGKDKDKKSSDLWKSYKDYVPLITRWYAIAVLVVTLSGAMLGDEISQSLMAFDVTQVFKGMEVWRFLTAATSLGPMALSWVTDGYHLVQYGKYLETTHGPSEMLVFLLIQIFLLAISSALLGLPFFTSSIIASLLFVAGRMNPDDKVMWVVVMLPMKFLVYANMLSDVLQAKSPTAAIPHILGIMTGHFYYFHRFIWPKMEGGEEWLSPPNFLVRRLDPDSKDESQSAIESALKNRKRGRGRKLGK